MPNRKGSYRKYKEEYADQMYKLMSSEGALDCHLCKKFKISGKTFYKWLDEIEEFKEAHEKGLPACEAWWVDKGMEGMQGKVKGFNAMTWIMFMNNKFKWSRNSGEQGNQTININQVNVLQDKSREGLINYIRKSIENNKDVIDVELIDSKEE